MENVLFEGAHVLRPSVDEPLDEEAMRQSFHLLEHEEDAARVVHSDFTLGVDELPDSVKFSEEVIRKMFIDNHPHMFSTVEDTPLPMTTTESSVELPEDSDSIEGVNVTAIVVPIVVGVLLIAFILYCCWKRKCTNKFDLEPVETADHEQEAAATEDSETSPPEEGTDSPSRGPELNQVGPVQRPYGKYQELFVKEQERLDREKRERKASHPFYPYAPSDD